MTSDHIVGIDLGTTNSLVAFMQGEMPVVIPSEDGLDQEIRILKVQSPLTPTTNLGEWMRAASSKTLRRGLGDCIAR